ncbi:MAG: hypothetical protein AAFY32_08855 [Pseudomonadota bacterium]
MSKKYQRVFGVHAMTIGTSLCCTGLVVQMKVSDPCVILMLRTH